MDRRLFPAFAAALLTAALALPLVAQEGVVELELLNGVYNDLDAELRPLHHGPLTIYIASPEHRLTVHRNRLTLVPAADGVERAEIEVELEGWGRLVADVEAAGTSTRFEDRVEAPRQILRVAGRARFERVDGGYQVTVVEAPPTLTLEIHSGMLGGIVDLCRAFDVLPLVNARCDDLARALSTVAVPLPEPGSRFLLRDALLTAPERAFFAGRVAP